MTHLQPVGKGIEFYCVNRQETTLLQEGAANTRIPAFDRTFLLSEDCFAGIPLPLPPSSTYSNCHHTGEDRSQRAAWNELKGLVEPCLHALSGPLHISCALILHGSRGAGKSSLVFLAAERFGLHVVPIDCYDLLNHSEVQTEVNLRGAFQHASNHSPCILYLRSLDAFDKTVGPQDSTRGMPVCQLLCADIPKASNIFKRSVNCEALTGLSIECPDEFRDRTGDRHC